MLNKYHSMIVKVKQGHTLTMMKKRPYLCGMELLLHLSKKMEETFVFFGFNGSFLGWYEDGVIYDKKGYAVGARKGAVSMITKIERIKGIQKITPIRPITPITPIQPI